MSHQYSRKRRLPCHHASCPSARRADCVKLERPALIVVGIENDADVVVAPCGVAITQIGANDLRIRVISLERNIEVFTVLNQERGSLDRGRPILGRVSFKVQLKPYGIGPLTGREYAVDLDLSVKSRNIRHTRVRGTGRQGEAQEGQQI